MKIKPKKSYNKGWKECKVKWYEKKVPENIWISIFSVILLIQFLIMAW